MAEKVTFNGRERHIYVNEGVTFIDVESELYSAWKRWLMEDNNAKWIQAFDNTGGEPLNIEETELSPKFFYLLNGWKIVVDNNQIVDFRLNLYTFSEDGEIYILGGGSSVRAQNSNATIIIINGPSQTVNVSEESIEEISLNTRKKIAQKYDDEVEIDSLDHRVDRIDKNTQK